VRLVVEDLVFAHPGAPPLLDRLSLTAVMGESVAIIGPSGSGKTTLLALVGGLLRSGGGRITLVDGERELPVRGNVSWVLQTVNVLSDRSVVDNIAVGAYADGLDREAALERARAALDAVGLAGQGHRDIRTLSGGEAQRAVIARATVSDRPVLLADEPTGQLDRDTSAAVIDTLLGAASAKITLVVTHDPAVAARCSRTLTLGGGTLTAVRP